MSEERKNKYKKIIINYVEIESFEEYINGLETHKYTTEFIYFFKMLFHKKMDDRIKKICFRILKNIYYDEYEKAHIYLHKKNRIICGYSQSLYAELSDEIKHDLFLRNLSKEHSVEAVRERIQLSKLIPENYVEIRITHVVPFLWNTIKSLAESFLKNPLVNLIILVGGEGENCVKCLKQAESIGANVIRLNEYDISQDNPDVVIFNVAHQDSPFQEMGGHRIIRENTGFIVVAPYDNTLKVNESAKLLKQLNMLDYDLFISAPTLYPSVSKIFKNTICMLNPKFDGIYEQLTAHSFSNRFSKLSGKRTVLWATIHGHDGPVFKSSICFDKYVKEILDWFRNHPDMGLIFRPHPALISEYVNMHHIWTPADLIKIKEYFNKSNNLVWDDDDDYSPAFAVSDALLVDSITGLNFSYLPTRKPICVSYRNRYEIPELNDDLTKNYYKAYDINEIFSFFEMISNGEDPLFDKRMETLNCYIPVFDGKCGERIAKVIMDEYDKNKSSNVDRFAK